MKHIKAALFALFAAVLSGGVFAFAIAEEAAVSVSGDVAAVNTEEAEKPLDLSRALEIEKSFVLESLTGIEGRDAGRHLTWTLDQSRHRGNTFCVSLDKCSGESCKQRAENVAKHAAKFVEDYNQAYGSDYLRFGKTCLSSYIKLYPSSVYRTSSGARAFWRCRGSISGGIVRRCYADFTISSEDAFIPHEMMNITGITDTRNSIFKECLVHDPFRRRKTYHGLCDIEKRVIAFQRDHLKERISKEELSVLFDKHWKTSDFTIALAKKYQPRKAGKKQFQTGGNR